MQFKNKKWTWYLEIALIIAFLVLGTYVRMVHLTSLPPGLYPDEAMNTTDGLQTAEAGGWKLFYENNQGREGLYMNILGYLLHWFGSSSIWIVRFLPALIGTLTLPAVYWLGRRLVGRFGALISLGLISFSYWHINFSRVGFRAILMVLVTAWAFAFIAEGFYRLVYQRKGALKCTKDKKKCDETAKIPFGTYIFFAVGGLFLGLSLHTYIAVRISPAVLFALWITVPLFFSNFLKDILKALLVTGVFAFITAAPMLYDFVKNPEHFTGRSSAVSVMADPNPALALGKSVSLTLASFVFYGDQNWRHNYPALPLLPPVLGFVLFGSIIWGFIYFFKELIIKFWKKSENEKEKTNQRKWTAVSWFFIISWWGLLLLPVVLTREGLPHALRSIGALVPTFLLLGMVAQHLARHKSTKTAFLLLVLIHGLLNVYVYFFIWGKSALAYGAFEHRLSGIGAYLNDESREHPEINLYMIANQDALHTDANLPVSMEPIRFFSWNYRNKIHYVLPEDFKIKDIKLPAQIVMQLDDPTMLAKVREIFPQAKFVRVKVGPKRSDDPISVQDKMIYYGADRPEGFFHPDIQVESYFTFIEVEK